MMGYRLGIAVMALSACTVAPADSPRPAGSPLSSAAPSPPPVDAPQTATTQPLPAQDCENGTLELRLTPSRARIVLGEPAVILALVRNCTPRTIEVPTDLAARGLLAPADDRGA